MEMRNLIKEILAAFIAFVFIFGIFSFWVGADGWDYLWSIIPFFALMFVRKKVNNFYMFMAIHLAIAGLPIWLWWGHDFFWQMVILFGIFAIYSIARRLDTTIVVDFKTGVLLALLLGSLTYAATAMNFTDIDALVNLYALLFIAGVGATIFSVQMNNMDSQLRLMEENRQFTAKTLFRANYITMGIFLGIVLALAITSMLFPVDNMLFLPGMIFAAFYWLAQAALFPFALIMGAIVDFFDDGEVSEPLDDLGLYVNGEYIPVDMEGVTPLLPEYAQVLDDGTLETLGDAASYVTMVAIGAVIVITMILLFRAMLVRMGVFKRKLAADVEVEKLDMNLKGAVAKIFHQMGERLRNPVRRAYRKKVNSHIKKGAKVKQHHTTENILKIISPEEDINELTKQ